MVVFDFDKKEEFTSATQVQNLGRLVARTAREGHDVLKELTLRAALPPKGPVMVMAGSSTLNSKREEGDTEGDDDFTHDFDSAQTRFVLWERVRIIREQFLKALVLVSLKDSLPTTNEVVRIGASIWDTREQIRRRAQDFFEIQWPPLGAFPPPMPPYAIDVAANVLLTGEDGRLPRYTQLAVEQVGSVHDESVKHLKLTDQERLRIERKLSACVLADYALAMSKNKRMESSFGFVSFSLEKGRIHLSCEGEFDIVFVTNLKK